MSNRIASMTLNLLDTESETGTKHIQRELDGLNPDLPDSKVLELAEGLAEMQTQPLDYVTKTLTYVIEEGA